MRGGHRVVDDLCLRGPERPVGMVDLGPHDPPAAISGEQTHPAGEPVLERSRGGGRSGPGRSIPGDERSRCAAPIRASRAIRDLVAGPGRCHLGPEVRQVEHRSSAHDDRPARGIERQEEHTGSTDAADVRANVELRERAQAWDGRERTQAWDRDTARRDVRHRERNDAEPRRTVEGVELEACRHDRRQRRRLDRPVGEQEIEPAHPDEPRSGHPGSAGVQGKDAMARGRGQSGQPTTGYSQVARYSAGRPMSTWAAAVRSSSRRSNGCHEPSVTFDRTTTRSPVSYAQPRQLNPGSSPA